MQVIFCDVGFVFHEPKNNIVWFCLMMRGLADEKKSEEKRTREGNEG